MPERIDADVCVVGAGYAGLTAARRLAASPGQVGRRARGRATASAAGSGPQHLADGTPVDRGGAWLARSTTRSSGSPRSRRRDVQDVGQGRAPARRRRPDPPVHRPHPEDQPARRRHDRVRAVEDRPARRSRCRSTRRGPPRTRREWDARTVGRLSRAHRDPHRDRARPVRDGRARAVHRRPPRHVVPPPAVARARATAASTRCSRSRRARRRTWSTAGAGSIARRVADELGDAVRLQRAGAIDHATRRSRRRRRRRSRSRRRGTPS